MNPIPISGTERIQTPLYDQKHETVSWYGTKVTHIFRGNDNLHEVEIIKSNIFQRLLARFGIGKKEWHESRQTRKLGNSRTKTTQQIAEELVGFHLKSIASSHTISKIQGLVSGQIIEGLGKQEKQQREAQKRADGEAQQRAVAEASQRQKAEETARIKKARSNKVDIFDHEGRTTLYRAVEQLNFPEIKRLVNEGADSQLPSNTPDKMTPKALFAKTIQPFFSNLSPEDMKRYNEISRLLGWE